MAGVWLCSVPWRDAHLDLIPSLESPLRGSNYNLKFIPGSITTPDFIATTTSESIVAFIVVTKAAYLSSSNLWTCMAKMGSIFQTSYVLVTITSEEENTAFNDAYFKFEESDKTPILQIQDKTMAGEVMMALATGHAELNRQDKSMYQKIEVCTQGQVGRTIDLKKIESYGGLRRTLALLFNRKGKLDDIDKGWQLVYKDHDNDELHMGDDRWDLCREFCLCVRSLRIVSPELAAAQCSGKQSAQQCSSSSEDDDGDWLHISNQLL